MLPGRTDNAVKNRFHITERLRNREKGDHSGKSVSDDSASIGNSDGVEVSSESVTSDSNGKKRPASCLQNVTKKLNQSADVHIISPSSGSYNESSSKRNSNILHGNTGSLQSPSGIYSPSSMPTSWSLSHLNTPNIETSLIDDSADNLPFRKEDFMDEGPNLLDFLEMDNIGGLNSSEGMDFSLLSLYFWEVCYSNYYHCLYMYVCMSLQRLWMPCSGSILSTVVVVHLL